MSIAEFIRLHMEKILQEWQDYAQTITAGKDMNQEALRDHARQMLEAIAQDLISPQTEAEKISKSKGQGDTEGPHSNPIDIAAREHGLARFGSGFDIQDLAAEYRALRASVLRLWGNISRTAQQSDLDEMTRFNEGIDQSLTESIAVYADEKKQQVRLLESMLSSSPDHSFIVDLDGRFLYANKSLADAFKLSPHEMISMNHFDLGVSAATATELQQQIQQAVRTEKSVRGEVAQASRWEERRHYEYIFTPVFDLERRIEAVSGVARDVTARKTSEDEIWRMANYDFLTGLPSRRLFRDRFEQEVKHSARTGIPVALLFIDLDRFKETNDLLGHDAGDLLLQQAAARIRSCVRDKDTVARLGGDEFTIILTDIERSDQIQSVAKNILRELENPFSISGKMVQISGSIGITLFPQDGAIPEILMRNADQAMYVAKNAGRNRFSFFTPRMQEVAQARYRLVADLRTALSRQELAVHYQPIVDLSNGQVHKAEALLRWFHPELGVVPAADFIGIAEETGLIHEIGNWVFAEAAAQSKAWAGLLGEPFQISINKSPLQLMSRENRMNWAAHVQQLGLACNSITVEITEGVLLNATTDSIKKLSSFQAAGIQLAIDDFGTGYSSMSYLNKFDVDFLKIDQSFVQNMVMDANSQTIVETIIVMAHKLGLKVIAEGVEAVEQRDLLRAAGADYAQGFLFSHALPAVQFTELLSKPRATFIEIVAG